MPKRLCTISKAAHLAGITRTTIQRWVKAGRLKKGKGGTVDLAAIERCKAAHSTGRPCGVRSSGYETLAEQLAKPFLGAGGLRRLRAVLRICAIEGGYRGKHEYVERLTMTLTKALAGFRAAFQRGEGNRTYIQSLRGKSGD